MEYISLCWMNGLTLNLQYFYMPVKSFHLDLMDLKEPVSSFLKRMRLTHLIPFDLDHWLQIIMVQILRTEKSLCHRPNQSLSIHLESENVRACQVHYWFGDTLVPSAGIFCRGVQCCADSGIYTWIVEPCISVEECNLPAPARIGRFLSNQTIFV